MTAVPHPKETPMSTDADRARLVEAMAQACFLSHWPKDRWDRFADGDFVKLQYRAMASAALAAIAVGHAVVPLAALDRANTAKLERIGRGADAEGRFTATLVFAEAPENIGFDTVWKKHPVMIVDCARAADLARPTDTRDERQGGGP